MCEDTQRPERISIAQKRRNLSRRRFVAGVAAGTAVEAVRMTRAQTTIHLHVTPTPLPVDVPAWIRLSGLDAGQEVTLRAEFRDAATNRWSAEATFLVDGFGMVDLAQQAPRRGSYARVDPMGLISSAAPVVDQSGPLFFPVSLTPEPLVISATVAGKVVATVDVPQSLLTTEIGGYGIEVRGAYGWMYRPLGVEPVPAVIVLGGSEGGLNPYVEREAILLASHGFSRRWRWRISA